MSGVSVSFAYVEHLVSCEIVGDDVKVVRGAHGILCEEYLEQSADSLEKLDEAIASLQSYVDAGKDAGYWRGILL